MANWLTRIFNRRQDGEPTQFCGYVGFFPNQYLPAGTYLSAEEAITLSAVWGCITFISNALATTEIKVLDLEADGSRKDASSDRVYRLFNLRPNPDTTAVALRGAWVAQSLVYGDGFLQIRRDMAGRPYELYLLPSVGVIPKREGEGIVYEYTPATAGVGKQIIHEKDIIHLPGPSLNSFLGESVITKAARSIAIAKAADEFALSYYANSTILGGTLTRTGPMNDKDLAALQENFEKARKGASKAHKAIVLPTGVTWQPIETDASKSQSVESRQHSVVDICRFFGVPPPLVGDLGRATWANLESLYIQVVRDCLSVWAKRIQEEVEWKCFGDASTRWIEVDLKPLTRGDAKSRAESNQILRRNGVINANEWREDEGLDPIGDEGDLYVIEANMTLLDEEALAPSEPVAPPATPSDPAELEEPVEDDSEEPPAAVVNLTVPEAAAFAQWLRRKRKASP